MSQQNNPVPSNAELQPERRNFLKHTGLMALGVAAASSLLNPNAALAAPHQAKAAEKSTSTQDDIAILNVALALEHQAIAAYQIGAESGLLGATVLTVAVKFQTHHKAHASVLSDTIAKLGGTAVAAKKPADYGFPVADSTSKCNRLCWFGVV